MHIKNSLLNQLIDTFKLRLMNLLKKHKIAPERFLMIGNSLKSDILPVVAIGGRAVYIHCPDTWIHEHVEDADQTTFESIEHIGLLPELLARLEHQ